MRALLIEWEASEGRRAGNINPKDPHLQCRNWQNMKVTPMLELRLVNDDRDLSYLEGVDGVTIILGADAINAAIDENFQPQYHIQDEFIFQEHLKQKNKKSETEIDIEGLPEDFEDRLKVLKDTHKVKGIVKKERKHV